MNLSASAMPMSAQSPPPLLQIVTERLRPGARNAYGAIEEELLHACRTLNAPNRYLALVSVDQPIEVWWLNMYDSHAEVDRVAQAYASNATLMKALHELSAKKSGTPACPRPSQPGSGRGKQWCQTTPAIATARSPSSAG